MSETGMKWYVLRAISGKEAKVKEYLEGKGVTCKTYTFTELLYKLLPKTPHEKVDLRGKLALEHHKLTQEFSGSIVLAPSVESKTQTGEKGGMGSRSEDKFDVLDNIIEKINLMYQGNFTESDRVMVETIYDAIGKEKKNLTKQVNNSDVNMFAGYIFPKIFEKIAQQCYIQQMDSFSKLFEEKSFYVVSYSSHIKLIKHRCSKTNFTNNLLYDYYRNS